MKSDTQHLDYLISQYVDGCLDSASKKSLEQKMVNDPVARKSYREQREVQDVLDDWGSRIPMIDWAAFDKKLAGRVEHEVVGAGQVSIFRRWVRPMSAAAALFIAATVGYSWHAWSTAARVGRPADGTASTTSVRPSTPVQIDDINKTARASSARFVVNDAPNDSHGLTGHPGQVAIFSPEDVAAAKSLSDALNHGLGQGFTAWHKPQNNPRGSSSAMGPMTIHKDKEDKEDKEAGPAFP